MAAGCIFETNRLILEPLGETHLEDLIGLDSDPAVMRYITEHTRTREETIANFEKYYVNPNHPPGLGAWAVREQCQQSFLGIAVLRPLDDRADIEVGYRLHRTAWGRGIATEAACRLIDYGFADLQLTEIVAAVHPENIASQKVIEKLGFSAAGTISAYGIDNLLYFKLTESDWK